MSKTRHDFAHDLLLDRSGVSGEDHISSLWALMAWTVAESGLRKCDGVDGAKNNPLNTTLILPGSTVFNSAGVRNYASYADGVNATVLTLKNSRYDQLVQQMAQPGTGVSHAIRVLWEVVGSPWGTSGRDAYGGLEFFLSNKSTVNQITVG